MKKMMIVNFFVVIALMATACNKNDDNKDDQGCIKEENYFEAQFDGQLIEPYYVQGGDLVYIH